MRLRNGYLSELEQSVNDLRVVLLMLSPHHYLLLLGLSMLSVKRGIIPWLLLFLSLGH